MKKIIFVILISISLYSCTCDEDKVRTLLLSEGCTDIKITGYAWLCKGKDDTFSTGFKATKNGQHVEGCVCTSLFKGYTIRYY